MDPKTQKIVRKVAKIVIGSMFAYVGAVTFLTGAVTIAKEMGK